MSTQPEIEAVHVGVVETDEIRRVAKPARSPIQGLVRKLRALLTPYLAISIGGALGANMRFLLGDWGTTQWGADFPYATLVINVTGSLVLGFYLALVTERFTGRVTTRLLVTTGFLGSYTTLSTFSVEAVRLVEAGAIGPALAYVSASVGLSLIAVGLGIAAAHAL